MREGLGSKVQPAPAGEVAPAGATQIGLGWSPQTIPIGSHVCFYYADDIELRQTLAFLRVGLDAPGDACVLFADRSRFPALLDWLGEGYEGDLAAHLERGKLVLIGGEPSLERLVGVIGQRLDAAVAGGYGVIRFLGLIGWGETGWPDERALLEFEATVNQVVTSYPAAVICTYGVPRLPGRTLIKGGLQTHPITIIEDAIVFENPHYVQPADFIRRLRQARPGR